MHLSFIFGYLYTSFFCHFFDSPNKRSFKGPGGVGRGLDLQNWPKSMRGNLPLWSPVVSRGLQGISVDDGTDNRYSSEASNMTLKPKF